MSYYERIVLDLNRGDCAGLLEILTTYDGAFVGQLSPTLVNLQNDLRARLQRTDVDAQCPKNDPEEDWLNA